MSDLKIYPIFRGASTYRIRDGFTLLEILASIVIFSVMITGISMTLSESTKLSRKVKHRESVVMSAQVAFDRLQRDLQMAFNERQRSPSSIFKTQETNQGPEITFSYLDTPIKVLVQNRTAGLMIARYHLEKSESGALTLFRSEVPFYKIDDIATAPSQTLAEGILSLKFEFYDYRNDQWLTKWDTSDPVTPGIFPRAIKMTIEAVDQDIPKEEWKTKTLKLETAFRVLNEMEPR